MDVRKVALGALFLFVSSVILLETGAVGFRAPLLVAAVASLGMAAGSLLVGATAEEPAV